MGRRLFLVLTGLVCCSGQACLLPCPVADEGRLEVTDELRDACPDWSDEEILDVILFTEQQRVLGQTWGSYTTAVQISCGRQDSWEDRQACRTCLFAITNQVYLAPCDWGFGDGGNDGNGETCSSPPG